MCVATTKTKKMTDNTASFWHIMATSLNQSANPPRQYYRQPTGPRLDTLQTRDHLLSIIADTIPVPASLSASPFTPAQIQYLKVPQVWFFFPLYSFHRNIKDAYLYK